MHISQFTRDLFRCLSTPALLGVVLSLPASPVRAQETAPAAADSIPIADVKRDMPVDFNRDVLPLLKRSCLACHNATTSESRLVLDTPATIAKGGDSGPALVA